MRWFASFILLLLIGACGREPARSGSSPVVADSDRALAVRAVETPAPSTSGATLAAFVPTGWHPMDTAMGLLDADDVADAAFIVEEDSATAEFTHSRLQPSPRRRLLVLLGTDDGGFRLSAMSDSVVLTAGQGGIIWDPYVDVVVERRTILLTFFGGSWTKWNLAYRFRFQDGRWILIGATGTGGNAIEYFKHDWNLSTGRLVVDEVYDREPERNRRERRTVRPPQPIDLTTFVPWSLEPAPYVSF